MSELTSLIFDYLIGPEIGLGEVYANIIVTVLGIVLYVIAGIVLHFIIKKIINKVMKSSKNNPRSLTVSKLINSLAKYLLWFVIGVSILGVINVDVAPILATAGVFGLAIGFGAQAIVKDFISGFFIIFEGIFHVGEVVEIDGFKGNVLSLGLRSTSIQNWKGEIKVISNGEIKSIINFSRNDSIAIVEFSVDYSTDLHEFNKIIEEFTQMSFDKYDSIVEPPKLLGVSKLNESGIDMTLIAKTNTMMHFQVERDLRKDIVAFCKEKGFTIPFPHLVVKND